MRACVFWHTYIRLPKKHIEYWRKNPNLNLGIFFLIYQWMSEIITSIETSTWLRLLLLLLLLPWSVSTFSPSHTRKFHFSLDPLTLILSFSSSGISSCFCRLLDCALEHEFLRILRVLHAYWSSHPAASFRMSKRESLFAQLIGLFLKMWLKIFVFWGFWFFLIWFPYQKTSETEKSSDIFCWLQDLWNLLASACKKVKNDGKRLCWWYFRVSQEESFL